MPPKGERPADPSARSRWDAGVLGSGSKKLTVSGEVAMTRTPAIGAFAVIGGLTAALALLTGPSAATADELADLRANQELLQKRIDQLSQAPPQPAPYVPGFGPETHKEVSGIPAVGGSFPRSFLIPGTDTSLRIGGFANASALWYIKGVAPGGQREGRGSKIFFLGGGKGATETLSTIPPKNPPAGGRSSKFVFWER